MAAAKNRWLGDAIGTARDYFRVGLAGPRLKNVAGVLQLRTANDGADANMKAAAIQLSTGPGAGKVLQSDASGNGSWVDPATVEPSADALPKSLFCTAPQFRTLANGGFAYPLQHSGAYLAMYSDLATLNAEVELTFSIAAGVYQPQSFHLTANTGAIVTISIDGVPLSSTLDTYTAVLNLTATAIWSNVTLAAGSHVLNIKITGRNASNTTGYHYWLSFFVLRVA